MDGDESGVGLGRRGLRADAKDLDVRQWLHIPMHIYAHLHKVIQTYGHINANLRLPAPATHTHFPNRSRGVACICSVRCPEIVHFFILLSRQNATSFSFNEQLCLGKSLKRHKILERRSNTYS